MTTSDIPHAPFIPGRDGAERTAEPAAPADIRAVFFDVDGTLTSFVTHEVPESTVRALRMLHERGVLTFLCTGRAKAQLDVVMRMLPVDFDGVVAMNGQYCFDDHGFLDACPLDVEDVATITAWLDRHPDIAADYCEADYVYFNQITEEMRASWRQLGRTAPTRHVDDPHVRPLTHDTFQISPFVTPEQEAELVGLCRNTMGVRWNPDFTDLIPADGGKPRGIRSFMRLHGFAREQTMAFGDGGNDMAMLEYAGIGVAMGNANDEVKACADHVTDDVDHDGVMNALLHFGVLD